MSLFPAYSLEDDTHSESDGIGSTKISDTGCHLRASESTWLSNSSYRTDIFPTISDAASTATSSYTSNENISYCSHRDDSQSSTAHVCHTEEKPVHHESSLIKTRLKKKRKKNRQCFFDRWNVTQPFESEVKGVYFEDKYRDKGNNMLTTLSGRSRPQYETVVKSLGFVSHKFLKKPSSKRYYTFNLNSLDKQSMSNAVITRDNTKNVPDEEHILCPSLSKWEELKKAKVKHYNEKLLQEPTNVSLWIKYIELQDNLEEFNNYQLAKDARRATIVKKLSIVEKALEKNSDSMQLLKIKLSCMAELLPADQFSNDLDAMVTKDSGNSILWQTYIMTVQGSVAMCAVPRVLELYSRSFYTLRQRAKTNPRIYDAKLMQMLYWCLTFLRQAGLWEQMWETIRLNLNLNLSLRANSLSFPSTVDEKKLISMEEVILMSRLPLNQLWQRTESLRENCHWVSVSRDELELVGDSRRFIIPEDVADFVHPILSPNSNFRLAVYSLLSLKVPLLPSRHSILTDFSLETFVWGAESSEILLPFLFPAVGEMAGYHQRKQLFSGVLEGRLTSGPQYILFHPAQEPFLDFLREIFRTIAEALPLAHRTSMYIWWLRFERLLIFLHKDDPMKFDGKGKKLKANLKEFLKQENNRNNLHFYREYALIERELGKFESCINVLRAAIQSNGTCPSAVSNVDEKAALLSLCRTYFEVLLDSKIRRQDNREQLVHAIEETLPSKEYLQSCMEQLLEELPADEDCDTFFLPNYKCDTVVCFAYLRYVQSNDIDPALQIFATFLEHYNDCPRLKERLYEAELALLQLHCDEIGEFHRLRKPLQEMLNECPNNFFGLSIFACLQCELPIWTFSTQKTNIDLWRAVAMCLAFRKRIRSLQEAGDIINTTAAINKLTSFHRTLSRGAATKNCPLLWRLYMLFLREHNLCEKKGEEVYHASVEQCPWTRCIYIDAAEVAPQLLTQIQDVIREKELRMHVTPEELDILRGS